MRSKIDTLENARIELAKVVVLILPQLKREVKQTALAKAIGISQSMVAQAAYGCGTIGTYIEICRALDIKFDISLNNDSIDTTVENSDAYIKRFNDGLVKFTF